MELNFKECNIAPNDFIKKIGAKEGYYLLRVEEDRTDYGSKKLNIHKISYSLLETGRSASGLIGICCGVFIWDLAGTITGYIDLGIKDEVIEL
jgi:hypothetical protein